MCIRDRSCPIPQPTKYPSTIVYIPLKSCELSAGSTKMCIRDSLRERADYSDILTGMCIDAVESLGTKTCLLYTSNIALLKKGSSHINNTLDQRYYLRGPAHRLGDIAAGADSGDRHLEMCIRDSRTAADGRLF